MQNKHNFFFLFGNPNIRGGGSSRLGQIPNFYRKFVSGASLTRSCRVLPLSLRQSVKNLRLEDNFGAGGNFDPVVIIVFLIALGV